MASATRSAGAGTSAAPGSVVWSNPGNVTASDDVRATAALTTFTTPTEFLISSSHGFSVPASATIDGIIVSVERSTTGNPCRDDKIRIVKGGTVGSTDKSNATNWPSTDTVVTYGSSSDLWGLTWTATDINTSDFGAAIAARQTGSSTSARIDHVEITVHYTVSDQSVAVGRATETDTALGLGVIEGLVIALDTATETDTALGLGIELGLGRATETDTALVIATPLPPATTIHSQEQARASTQFQAALRQTHKVATLVQVFRRGELIREVPVISGGVTIDSGAAIRARCELEFADDGSLDIVPTEPGDDLAPYINEIRVCRGISYPSGAVDLVSLGVFGIRTVTTDDSGDTLTLRVSAADRAARVSGAEFESKFEVAAGTLFTTAIKDAILPVYPGLESNLLATSVVTPHLVGDEGDNRWDFAQGLAEALGAELYFDSLGVLRLVPLTVVGEPVAEFVEGEDGVLLGASREWSREDSFNRVIVVGEAADDAPPPRGVATDDDPASPTYYDGDFGKVVDRWSSPFITVTQQATDAARGRLARNLGTTQAIGFGALVNPSLEPSVLVRIQRERAGIASSDHIIDQLTIPLGPEAEMSGTTRVTRIR